MDRLLVVAVLTALIHLINTLIYAVRVSGVRTGRLATAISLFNVIFLISSTANMIQGPLLATIVEGAIHKGFVGSTVESGGKEMNFPPAYIDQIDILAGDIRLVLLAATFGTIIGMLLISTFENFFSGIILIFEKVGSVPGLIIMAIFSPRRMIRCLKQNWANLSDRDRNEKPPPQGLPLSFLMMNIMVTGIYTSGVLAALYAGALYPDYRASATMLASVVNGMAQVLFATMVDPVAARITDQALQGQREESDVRRMSYYLAGTRVAGTLLAQILFIPAAYLIRLVAVSIT